MISSKNTMERHKMIFAVVCLGKVSEEVTFEHMKQKEQVFDCLGAEAYRK